ncbi:hypothetical protein D3C78_670550 [compost metagenome]
MAHGIEHVFAMVGQVQQEAVRIGPGVVLDQAGHHEVVVQHGIVIAVVGRHLIVTYAGRYAIAVLEPVEGLRVAVLVAHVRAEQMHDDEFARCPVGQGLVERLDHVAVVLRGVLVAVVVQVHLLVGLFGEGREHGVALGHGLLVGDPEGLVACLFHHADQRWRRQVQVRVFFVGEGQDLLQRLNGVGARGDDVVENVQLILELVQFRRGWPGIAVQAHALTVGGLADHQHQGRRRVGHGVLEVVQRCNPAGAVEHVLHAGQGFQITVIGHGHLPWHRRLDAGFELVEAFGETAGA